MYKRIIKQFIKKFKDKHPDDIIDITGILGFGSYFNSKKTSQNSDMDIYVVIKNINKRYRGIMYIGDVEIDYFINPIERLKSDWEKVKNKTAPRKTIAYMLRDGNIILDHNNSLKKLQQDAKKFLRDECKNNKLDETMLVTAKYFIQDYLKDIQDSLLDNNIFSWQYNVNSLLNYLIEIFCQYHKIPVVKQKYQVDKIIKKDKQFVKLYESISGELSRKKRTKRINALALYCLKNMGGELPKEWEIEGPAGV